MIQLQEPISILALFSNSRKVWEQSGGAFDITIGPLAEAWGFGFKNKAKLDSAKVDKVVRW